MKNKLFFAAILISAAVHAQTKTSTAIKDAARTTSLSAISKIEMDRAAIRSMAGIYKVSFQFAETFSPDTGYRYHSRYKEWGIEYVLLEEDSPGKIVLQHLLIVNDTIIIKHWRQDWVYENTQLYNYYRDNEWLRETLTPAQAKGTWTQKVYQVDDSPRYESYGTWVHVDGRHFWQGVTDAPLPRREFTKRDDYNVMRRHSHVEVLPDGWKLEQDNEKILRSNGIDKLLCWEKGLEQFTKGSYTAVPAQKWWSTQHNYWADVRQVWDEVYAMQPALRLLSKVNDKRLYEHLFELGDTVSGGKTYVRGSAVPEIRKIITSFVKSA